MTPLVSRRLVLWFVVLPLLLIAGCGSGQDGRPENPTSPPAASEHQKWPVGKTRGK